MQELIPDFDALHAIAKKIMRLPCLSPEPPLLLDAMSYIIVPPGSSPQAWHIDFNMGNCPGMVPMTDEVVEAMTEYIDGSNDVFDRLWKNCEEGKDEEIIIKDVLRACPGGVINVRRAVPHLYTPFHQSMASCTVALATRLMHLGVWCSVCRLPVTEAALSMSPRSTIPHTKWMGY